MGALISSFSSMCGANRVVSCSSECEGMFWQEAASAPVRQPQPSNRGGTATLAASSPRACCRWGRCLAAIPAGGTTGWPRKSCDDERRKLASPSGADARIPPGLEHREEKAPDQGSDCPFRLAGMRGGQSGSGPRATLLVSTPPSGSVYAAKWQLRCSSAAAVE